jgi:glycosyltransferase involved in cell wall biosynthesis
MRIGMILDTTFPPDARVEKEALSLIEDGHEVYLFSLDYLQRSGLEIYNKINVVRYPAGTLLYKLSALVYTFPFYRWRVSSLLNHFIKTYQIQVLHIHDMVIADSVFYTNRSFHLPVVLDYHENRPEIMKHYKHVNTFSGKLLIDLRKWSAMYYELASKAQRVVVVTDAAKRNILERTGKDSNAVAVVPNTARLTDFSNNEIQQDIVGRMQGSFNLLYIGDTSIRRGTDTAIRALSIIKETIPTVKLWLVGKSSADGELKELSRKLNVDQFIMYEGWQDPSTFPSYLEYTHIGLSPLKRNEHHDTTFANKLFQYMVCGKPVVVSDCVAQAELVTSEQCGLVFKADDPQDMATKIVSLYSNKADAQKMGARSKEAVVTKWNWDLTVKQLTGMYRTGISI